MDVVGDEIVRILHNGGIQRDNVVVDTFGIQLKSGRCFELTEHGAAPIDAASLKPNPAFDRFIGLRILAVESCDAWPTRGIRLSNGCVLMMGSPSPYYWGMQEADDA
jgi:hypothetical protein